MAVMTVGHQEIVALAQTLALVPLKPRERCLLIALLALAGDRAGLQVSGIRIEGAAQDERVRLTVTRKPSQEVLEEMFTDPEPGSIGDAAFDLPPEDEAILKIDGIGRNAGSSPSFGNPSL